MRTRYYEIVCDVCGWIDHYLGNAIDAEQQAKKCGWIITEDGKHYCSAKCRDANKGKITGIVLDEFVKEKK